MPDKPLIHFRRETFEPQGINMARLLFNPHDCWVGVYWKQIPCERCKRNHLNLWLIILPCFPLHIILK